MGFDLLNMGSQGLMTAQRQLNTTGHNINNVNTEATAANLLFSKPMILFGGGAASMVPACMRQKFAAASTSLPPMN